MPSTMELKGNWSEKPVIDEIRQEKYDLAIFEQVGFRKYVSSYRDFTDYSENVVQALNENYVVLCGTMEALVLKPRNREITLSPDFFTGMFNKPCGTGQTTKAPTLKVRPGTR